MVGGAPVGGGDVSGGEVVDGELGAGVGDVTGGEVGVDEGREGEVGEVEGGNVVARLASTHAEVFSADRPACREIARRGRRVRLCRA